MLGNVATLLGLLGTIVGLIGAFGAVANANPADKATILAYSISEAMNCTAFGLFTGHPRAGLPTRCCRGAPSTWWTTSTRRRSRCSTWWSPTATR